MSIATVEELLVEELRDIYDAEKQLVKALPKMAKSVSHPELRSAFENHLKQTKGQVTRLEKVFETLGQKPRSRPCKGMKGIVEEGREAMSEDATRQMHDSFILDTERKVEHYEIAGYENVRSLARMIGRKDAVALIEQNLNEEIETDRLLAKLAKGILKNAMREEEAPSRGARAGNGRVRRANGRTRRAGARVSTGNGRARATNGRTRAAAGRRSKSEAGSHITTDHDQIRHWAEERGGVPVRVKGTGRRNDPGVLRIDFPGYSGGEKLEKIPWREFFRKFDDNKLAFLYQEETARGQKSNFNKLISRQGAQARRA
ncbi:MAG: ferritin-like domain-containing protein [Bryobacteraceae bacterium]